MKLDLLSNATVVEKAVQFVERHRGMTHQNEEVAIDNDAAELIKDTELLGVLLSMVKSQ